MWHLRLSFAYKLREGLNVEGGVCLFALGIVSALHKSDIDNLLLLLRNGAKEGCGIEGLSGDNVATQNEVGLELCFGIAGNTVCLEGLKELLAESVEVVAVTNACPVNVTGALFENAVSAEVKSKMLGLDVVHCGLDSIDISVIFDENEGGLQICAGGELALKRAGTEANDQLADIVFNFIVKGKSDKKRHILIHPFGCSMIFLHYTTTIIKIATSKCKKGVPIGTPFHTELKLALERL